MSISPRRPSLYRSRLVAVIFILAAAAGLAAVWAGCPTLHAQVLIQQYGRKPADTGPRALGLVQLSSTGKARFIPIAIMMNGKFYDAGSFKATPVPMALDFGVVYEAFHTGVSQGLFTITQPGQLRHSWVAEGTWLPAGAKAPETSKKYAEPVIEDKDDRPVLHRRAAGSADKDESKPTTNSTSPPSTGAPSSAPSGSTSAPSTSTQPSASSSSPASSTSAPASDSKDKNQASKDSTASKDSAKDSTKDAAKAPPTAAATSSDLDQPFNDPNRPILRRGKPSPNAHHELFVNFDEEAGPAKPASATGAAKSGTEVASVQTFAAISDAAGPDPRPYTYDLKPAEQAIYRTKMLDLAATLVKIGTLQGAAPATSSTTSTKGAAPAHKKTSGAKTTSSPKPQFEDVNLRIFDLSTSNEPVLVLSARTPVPPAGSSGAQTPPGARLPPPSGSQVPQEITLIARTNLEGELQKLFFAQTDSRHLDVRPRMELIDAVDADGDGRGELLFRQTSDAGSAYAIYRVTADGLWPLYEGTP